jgi:hypothetical protein
LSAHCRHTSVDDVIGGASSPHSRQITIGAPQCSQHAVESAVTDADF